MARDTKTMQHYMTFVELAREDGGKCKSLHLVTPTFLPQVVAGFVVLFLFVLAGALLLAPWVQVVTGSGRVIAYSPNDRQQSIESPIEGRVSEWFVAEGQSVKKGDRIVELSDIDPNIMERIGQELAASEMKLAASRKALETSQKNVTRQKGLAQQGLSSQRAVELAELEYNKILTEISTAAGEVARMKTRLSRQASQVITATRDGTIMRIVPPQGGVIVKAGDALAYLVPESEDRAVELFIGGNDLPLISVGDKVRLQFEGWPAIQFTGWPSVAVGTFGGTVGVIDASDDGSGSFRLIVFKQEGEKWPSGGYLRQGVKVIGWVLLDTVPLGWELWRKFNGFPVSVSGEKVPAESKLPATLSSAKK